VPEGASPSLEAHVGDSRDRYALDDLVAARTHDEVWNAAQRQLLTEGRIHNYLRMVWGKRILEWTDGPREAVACYWYTRALARLSNTRAHWRIVPQAGVSGALAGSCHRVAGFREKKAREVY